MSSDDEHQPDVGIRLYDLEPPSDPPPVPSWSPLRHPGQAAPAPRYLPPPVPEGFARVELDDDYYAGPVWSDWAGGDHQYPARVFDVPVQQHERWQRARDAYAAMQEEISTLRDARLRTPGWVPGGWVRKPPYQAQP